MSILVLCGELVYGFEWFAAVVEQCAFGAVGKVLEDGRREKGILEVISCCCFIYLHD